VKTRKPRRHKYRVPATLNAGLELDFRRAVQQVPSRERPSLRAWLRRYARTLCWLDPACRASATHAHLLRTQPGHRGVETSMTLRTQSRFRTISCCDDLCGLVL